MTGQTEDAEGEGEGVDRSHLENVDDGCGCTEIWEHMSDERDAEE